MGLRGECFVCFLSGTSKTHEGYRSFSDTVVRFGARASGFRKQRIRAFESRNSKATACRHSQSGIGTVFGSCDSTTFTATSYASRVYARLFSGVDS